MRFATDGQAVSALDMRGPLDFAASVRGTPRPNQKHLNRRESPCPDCKQNIYAQLHHTANTKAVSRCKGLCVGLHINVRAPGLAADSLASNTYARVLVMMSRVSVESPSRAAIRCSADSAFPRRPASSARQERKLTRSRAATCGFWRSRSPAKWARKSYPAPSGRLNWVWLPAAKLPISARMRLGLESAKAGPARRARTRSRVSGAG